MDRLPSCAPDFFSDVRSILAAARSRAAAAVNTAMVEAYWLIGKRIVEEEQQGHAKATYGERLLEELSRHLGDQFGKGFSVANLRNFRQFYLTYPDQKGIHYTLCSELSWSQMDMYVRMFDDLKRGPDDNPTLGIILCTDKDETVVHYSVLKDSEQLFASKYRTLLPTEEELAAEIERERQLIEHRHQSES